MSSFSKVPASGCQRFLPRTPLYIAIVAGSSLFLSGIALAGPEGGKITGGNGSIARAGTNTNVQQLTERMSVEWQSFDLGRKDSVNFLQPGSSSLVLNHILQNGPSQIDGRINANGHVLLINPRGVIFGENSVINVGALTASTLWMNKDDFLNGDMVLKALDDSKGVVINSGLISAASGGVTLLGEGVSNEGLITAELGYVNLVSGREAYLTFDEEGFLGVKVTEDVVENLLGEESNVENSGEISATGGKVIMNANVSRGLFDSAVNNSGIIAATGFDDVPGGTVHLLGDTVAVTDGARISVDGDSRGGEILVGGDYQGVNPDIENARLTRVAQDTVLSANALESGDGGKVIVWADDTAEFHGSIAATGGREDGDGGLAEVSGKEHVWITGTADLRAANGNTGSLLIDPGMVTIKAGTAGESTADMVTDGWINAQIQMAGVTIVTISTEGDGDNGDPPPGDPPSERSIVFMPDDLIRIVLDDSNPLSLVAGKNITFTSDTTVSLEPGAPVGSLGFLSLNIGREGTGGILDFAGVVISDAGVLITGGVGQDTVNYTNAVTLDVADLVDIEFVNANSAAGPDRLTGAELYTIGADGVTSGNTLYAGFNELEGKSDGDSNTIEGATAYEVIADNEGTADAYAFTLIQNLTGNDGDENIFTLTSGAIGVLSGLDGKDIFNFVASTFDEIKGGPGEQDEVNFANAVTLDVADLVDIEFVNANSAAGPDKLTGAELYTIGADGVTSGNTLYAGFNELEGKSDGDSNTIEGATAYEVIADNEGTADAYAFTLIQNLTGNDGDENIFTLTSGAIGVLSGLDGKDIFNFVASTFDEIKGGPGEQDEVNFANAVTLDVADLVDIEFVNANSAAGPDKLTGAELYTIGADGVTSGNTLYAGFNELEGKSDGDSNTIEGATAYEVIADNEGTADAYAFTLIQNLTGNDGDENIFTLTSGAIGVLSGLDGKDIFNFVASTFDEIKGGPGEQDEVNFANAVTLDVADLVDIEFVNANSAAGPDKLTGAELYTIGADGVTSGNTLYAGFNELEGKSDGDSNTIEGATAYEVIADNEGTADAYAFTLIQNLTGNDGDENIFTLTSGAIGVLSGLDGKDIFNFVASTFDEIKGGPGEQDEVNFANAVTLDVADLVDIEFVNANSAAGPDKLTGAELYTIGADGVTSGNTLYAGFNELEGKSDGDSNTIEGATAYEVIADNEGTADAYAFTLIQNLTGNDGDENIFTLTSGAIGVLSGLDGKDIFNFVASTFDEIKGGPGEQDEVNFANAVTLDVADLVDIEFVNANSAAGPDKLTGAELYTIGADGVTSGNTLYAGFNELEGKSDGDSNTIEGATAYEVIADNEGTADAYAFTLIQNLTGNDGDENIFTLTSGAIGVLSGLDGKDIFNFVASTFDEIKGGPGEQDEVNFANAVTLDVADLVDIEFVNANSAAGPDKLTGAELYTIGADGVTSGNTLYAGFNELEGKSDGDSNTIEGATAYEVIADNEGTADAYAFTLIQNLTGNDGDENIFTLTSGAIGVLSGLDGKDIFNFVASTFDEIKGGPGEQDEVNFANAVTLDVADLVDIEFVNANSAAGPDKLTGAELYTIGADGVTSGNTLYAGFNELEGKSDGDSNTIEGATAYEVIADNEGTADAYAFTLIQNLTGTGGIDIFTLTAGSIDNLSGLGGNDTFNLDGGAVTGSITGGEDMDTVVGASIYVVTDDGIGTADGYGFTGMENLTGTGGIDIFTLMAGSIDNLGGLGGNDTFNLDGGAVTGSITGGEDTDTVVGASIYVVTDDGIGTADGYGFTGMENLTGTGGIDILTLMAGSIDNLSGLGGNDTFNLDGGAVTGSITGGEDTDTIVGASTYVVTDDGIGTADGYRFTEMENLTGTGGIDTFTLTAGSIDNLNGLGGNDTFNLDGGAVTGNIAGGTDTDTIVDASTYVVTGDGIGTADGYAFTEMETLTGDAGLNTFTLLAGSIGNLNGLGGEDTFNLDGGAVTGNIVGGADTDTIVGASTYVVTGDGIGTADGYAFIEMETLTGDAGLNTFTLMAGSIGNLNGLGGDDTFNLDGGAVTGNIAGGMDTDTIVGASTYVVTGDGIGTADGYEFTEMEDLTGTDGIDTFTLKDGVIQTLRGLGGDDTFDLSPGSTEVFGGIFGGDGSMDKLINNEVGEEVNSVELISGGKFMTVSPELMVTVEEVEFVEETGPLKGTSGEEIFGLFGDNGVTVVMPAPEISFTGVTLLDGGGGPDLIDAQDLGVMLDGPNFFVGDFIFPIENIFTVNNVGTLQGDDINENYALDGTTATVNTQVGSSFLGVSQLLGGGNEDDMLDNRSAGVTLIAGGFTTGGGVEVSQIESVISTGNLTGSAASEVFTLSGDEVSVVPPGASIVFSGVEDVDGGPGVDTLTGSSEYVLTSENGGSAGARQFASMENLQGTPDNDTFTKAGGSLSGTIDGLEQQGGEGDSLVGFSTYVLSTEGTSTADGIAFENIESLTGTDGDNDLLEGVNEALLTEVDGGTANEFVFHDIENLAGTPENDSFTLAGGSLSGSIGGREGGDDILVGFSTYVLTGLNMGTANDTIFTDVENLRGTSENDSFTKENSNGRLTGLIQGEGEIPDSDGDRLLGFENYSILGVGSGIADGTEYEGIESVNADGNGSLLGSDEANIFVLTEPGSGTVDGLAFSGFANLGGLGGDDVFQREEDGALSDTIDGGDGDGDRMVGFIAYLLDGLDTGTADGTNFISVENLLGTSGNDSFTNAGGSLTGVIDGLEQAGGAGDQLIGFSRYDLDTGDLPTAEEIRFENIESLVGTSSDDDQLVGGSEFEVNGTNSGNVNGSISFSQIEYLEGTPGNDSFDINSGSIVTLDGLAGDDLFVLDGGVVTGAVIGGEGFDEISGANLYVLTDDNKGTASLLDANGNTTSSAPFETVESLVGTSGSDIFDLGGYTLSGRIDGLGDSTNEGPGLVIDRVIFVQDQESQGNIGILVTDDGDPATDGNGYIGFGLASDEFENAGTEAFQLRYVGIEDFLLMLEQDLNIKGIGTISSSADIEVKGSLNMYGPSGSDAALTLEALENITIQQNLLATGRSVIDVSTPGTVLTIGGSVSIDTANGAEVIGLVSVTITEEPVIQIEVEETTSLSIFGKVDIFPARRNSVARQSDENELSSEDELIEALRMAEPVY